MKNVTIDQLRDLVDQLGIRSRKLDDGKAVVASLSADENFPHIVNVCFIVEGDRLQFQSYASDFQGSRTRLDDALEFCNKWNLEKVVPKATIDGDGDFRLENSLFTDVEISAEYIKTNFIQLGMSSCWRFFVEAGKEFD